MAALCAEFGLTRQGHWRWAVGEPRQALASTVIVELVLEIRRRMPRLGGRKLHYLLRPDLERMGVKLGRDALFELLGAQGLLIEPRRRSTRTTNSFHRFRVWPNLIRELEVSRPDQVWVADLTYLRCLRQFVYLFLVSDLYSRKIVGWALGETLEARWALEALRMALAGAERPVEGLIHHSDRGVQYCCEDYVGVLKKEQARISMAEVGNPYANAVAERICGILKGEFYLDRTFAEPTLARRAALDAIAIYNHERPHTSLRLLTPAQCYAVGRKEAA
jgi:transposase InsO family protein